MNSIKTKELIEKILTESLTPSFIEIIDETHLHKGHKAILEEPTLGYFKIICQSPKFEGLSLIKKHRLIYDALGDLMHTKIHALSIEII